MSSNRTFCVAMRGPSAALFKPDRTLSVAGVPSECGTLSVVYRSRWLKQKNGCHIPGNLWLEIRGGAPDLETAIPIFANAGLSLIPLISVGTNTAIFDPEVEVAFETTPSAVERDFFQSYLLPEPPIAFSSRLVDDEAIAEWISAFTGHLDAERLFRAANQYNLAIRNWKYGHAIVSLAHLWMAIEVLTDVKIRYECANRQLSKEQLCEQLKVSPKELGAVIRRDFLLKGDKDCYKEAKAASDGFEHGYLGFDKVADISKLHREVVAAHVRAAILELSGVSTNCSSALLQDRFSQPKGYWPLVKYLRGTLKSEHDELYQAGSEYPFFRWRPEVLNCQINENSKIDFTINENITAKIGNDVTFQPKTFEIWEPT